MSKLTDILDSGLFIDSEAQPDYRTGNVRQEVKDLFLELIGELEYQETARTDDWINGRNALRIQLKRKVEDL
jgi:hypothetical protein